MEKIKYKGNEYPTRTFVTSFEGREATYTIATESLAEALGIHDGKDLKGRAEDIDQSIYYYVEDEHIELSAEEICNDLLDVSMEFVEEVE